MVDSKGENLRKIIDRLIELEKLEHKGGELIRNKHIKEYTKLIGELNRLGYEYKGSGDYSEVKTE